jgi:hypothetical protein
MHYRLGPFARRVLSSPPVLPLRVQSARCHHYYRPADFPDTSSVLTHLFIWALKRSILPIPIFDNLRLPLHGCHQCSVTVQIMRHLF